MSRKRYTIEPKIEHLDPRSLHPNPKNARKHSKKQIELLKAGISAQGFLSAIVVDTNYLILAGHGRWQAAIELGLPLVPVMIAHFLTEKDALTFALGDNRSGELSTWDDDILTENLTELFGDGEDISLTGFTLADLDLSLSEDPPKDKEMKPELVELPDPDTDAVTRPGDLWIIGPHRLLCGDATKLECYELLLGDERVMLIVTDPPYNVPIDGHVSGLGHVRHREFRMATGEMTPAQFTAFLRAVFKFCVRFSEDGTIHYVFMDWRHIREILDASDGVYSEFKQLIVWAKSNAGMSSFYRSQHELIFVFKSGSGRHVNNFGGLSPNFLPVISRAGGPVGAHYWA